MAVTPKKKPSIPSASRELHRPGGTNSSSTKKVQSPQLRTSTFNEIDEECEDEGRTFTFRDNSGQLLLPNGLDVKVPEGSIICVSGTGRIISHNTNGGRYAGKGFTLLARGVLRACTNCKIRLEPGYDVDHMHLPLGTIVRSDTPIWDHRQLEKDSTITTEVILHEALILGGLAPVLLEQPLYLGGHSMLLPQDTILPGAMTLGNEMTIVGQVTLPKKLIHGAMRKSSQSQKLNVIIDGKITDTYVPDSKLRSSTKLPWRTVLPAGITLNKGTRIPAWTTLPSGTYLHPNTVVNPGAILPVGLHLPKETMVPPHVYRCLDVQETQEGNSV